DLELGPHFTPHSGLAAVALGHDAGGAGRREEPSLLAQPRQDARADEQRLADRAAQGLARQPEIPGRIDLELALHRLGARDGGPEGGALDLVRALVFAVAPHRQAVVDRVDRDEVTLEERKHPAELAHHETARLAQRQRIALA